MCRGLCATVADDRELVKWVENDQKRSQQAFGEIGLEMRLVVEAARKAVASE
jgi:hypothetical protein